VTDLSFARRVVASLVAGTRVMNEGTALDTWVARLLANEDWRARYAALAERNLARWNDLARGDRDTVISLIASLAA